MNNKWDGLKKILQKKGEGIQDMGVGMEKDPAKFGTHTIISTAKGKVSFSSRNYGNFLLAMHKDHHSDKNNSGKYNERSSDKKL